MSLSFIFSTFILLIIGYGLFKRRYPVQHIPAMSIAFALDVALVLYIELTRHAIDQAVEGMGALMDNTFLLFHVIVSLITLILYVVLTVTGYKILRGDRARFLLLHRNFAAVFIVFRLINYVTSYWM